jgi:cytidine deaminase
MQPKQSQLNALYTQALLAAEHAYAPYSQFRVGAAILFNDGTVVTGCNVENASYGLTLCAERSAMVRAVSARGSTARVSAIAIANKNAVASPPCGACRQVLSEFVTAEAVVIFAGESGRPGAPIPFAELMPHSFHLPKPELPV